MSKKLAIVLMSVSIVSGCAQQQKQTQAQLDLLQTCLTQQKTQEQTANERQAEVLIQLQQLQQRVEEQSLLLEAKTDAPAVIANADIAAATLACSESEKNKTDNVRAQGDKQIVGLHEQALILGLNIVMRAHISTNVDHSVLDARNIQMFERNGEEWVRFTIYHPDTKEPHVLERKRLRFHSLTSANTTNVNAALSTDKRPVVEIRFTLGKLTQKGEFVLSDRSQSESPMLIGRNLLRDVMLVDVSEDYLAPLQKTKK